MAYDDLSLEQLTELHDSFGKIKDIYLWALSQNHIKKPLAYAIYQVWKWEDKENK